MSSLRARYDWLKIVVTDVKEKQSNFMVILNCKWLILHSQMNNQYFQSSDVAFNYLLVRSRVLTLNIKSILSK